MRDEILLHLSLAGDAAPEWVHLVPAGTFSGIDGRGPYVLHAPDAVVASLAPGGKLPIDENHAIDVAAPKGQPSPARGWITELQARADGIWGRVEWTETGRALLADKAYRGISPALRVEASSGRVVGVARASLVNTPNLNLTSLHQMEDRADMNLTQLREALGLPADADEAAIVAAARDQRTALTTHQAQTAEIAHALGLASVANGSSIVMELQTREQGRNGEAALLRTTVVELQTRLDQLGQERARDRAVQFVDGAITAGHVGLKPLRDHYITRHMADPAAVEKEVAAMPVLHAESGRVRTPAASGGNGLDDAEREVCELMGLDPVKFAEAKALQTKVI